MTDESTYEKRMERKLDEWLDKSGDALELRVARAFRLAGFNAQHAALYNDLETQTTRETDVVASRLAGRPGSAWTPDKTVIRMSVVAECKSSRIDPWVIFEHDDGSAIDVANKLPKLSMVDASNPWAADGSAPQLGVRVGIDCPLLGYSFASTHGYVMKTAGKEDFAYRAVLQLLSAARAIGNDRLQEMRRDWSSSPVLHLTLPVLVVSAPIYLLKLNGDGHLERRVVDKALLLNRDGPSRLQMTPIWVTNEVALPDLVAAAVSTAEALSVD